MIYSVAITISSETSLVRFAVVAAALAVTIVIGYLKFVRGRRRGAVAGPAAVAAAGPEQAEFGARLAVVEHKLDALARALQ